MAYNEAYIVDCGNGRYLADDAVLRTTEDPSNVAAYDSLAGAEEDATIVAGTVRVGKFVDSRLVGVRELVDTPIVVASPVQ